MDIAALSACFAVRRLGTEDVEAIYDLCRGNPLFYQYHPPFVTRESILEDLAALPPGKTARDKFFIGFFEDDALIAVMDLIAGYPESGIGFIGLFMMNARCQKQGIGSRIIRACAEHLRSSGFQAIRLGVDKGNPQSNAFWRKNGFVPIREDRYILMELNLSGHESLEKAESQPRLCAIGSLG